MIIKITTATETLFYEAHKVFLFKPCEGRNTAKMVIYHEKEINDAYINPGTTAEVFADGVVIQTYPEPAQGSPAETLGTKSAAEEFPITIDAWVEAKQEFDTKDGAVSMVASLEKYPENYRNVRLAPDSISINAKWVVTWERKA